MFESTAPLADIAPRAALLSDEPATILRFLVGAMEAGIACALATLVEIRGGSARALGAQMAVRADGLFCGQVSGGCVEAAVAREAMIAIANGGDRFLHLGEGSPFFDIRLPCGGGIRLAIHVLKDDGPVRAALALIDARRPATLFYDAATQTLGLVHETARTGWQEDRFLRVYCPAVRALVAGRPMELFAMTELARAAGYDTFTPAGSGTEAAIDADTAVVILLHDIDREVPLLIRALESKAFYIGALGSARTHERRVAALKAYGVGAADIARIRAPIGLFPKARDARTLALSVVAEIAAVRSAMMEV